MLTFTFKKCESSSTETINVVKVDLKGFDLTLLSD